MKELDPQSISLWYKEDFSQSRISRIRRFLSVRFSFNVGKTVRLETEPTNVWEKSGSGIPPTEEEEKREDGRLEGWMNRRIGVESHPINGMNRGWHYLE